MEAVDVLLMAKGSAAEVGYVTDVDLLSDLCDLGLEEYSRAMIHSHHNMATNPSTTDLNELRSAASTGPYYLSVIVNNRMEVTALVGIKSTIKGTAKSTIRNLFGKLVKTGTKEIEYEDYEIIECEVVKEEVILPKYMQEVNERLAKIQNYNTAPHSKRSGYINQQKKASSIKVVENFNYQEGKLPFPEEDSTYDEYIPQALQKYCYFADGGIKSAYNAALAIQNDPYSFGIPVSDYLAYLRKNTIDNASFTRYLIEELTSPIVM